MSRFIDNNIEYTDSDFKVHALPYANMSYLHASDFPFKNFCKPAQHVETIRKNVWEKSNGACLLSIRVQTTINHISICFLPQYQRTGRRGGLMVSALDSGRAVRVRALAEDIVLCSWAIHFTLTVPLST